MTKISDGMEKMLLDHDENLTDSLVWAMFREGDDRSMNLLLLRYFRPLLHYGSKFTNDRLLVEDVIQDLFLGFLEKREFLSSPACLKNYLFKCLRNNLVRAIKQNTKAFSIHENEDIFTDLENIEEVLVATDESEEISMKLNRHFLSLTKRQKEALFLRYYENRSNDEIAEIMEINKQSVSNLLLKSLAILRENWVHVLILLLIN